MPYLMPTVEMAHVFDIVLSSIFFLFNGFFQSCATGGVLHAAAPQCDVLAAAPLV
ncbi:hypothetical protein PF010_g23415 [Phytophthora fragariae]|uniref:Uncharacterized protein n=2 Tax=Phytophthora TaxID=4783 RepID=A0A6A4DHY1_9STRA|nr:hypothetical protein PF003_g2552 [Phytophthora fragariae]KAE8990167.1 hypothetical protein PR002_g21233 [Phytophthora rubi]KAE9077691.1 hypothetical protein PF010_g23415 [Phytophthora fragariae]KAE9303549.1 hypothetical protein PR003_g21983 [Phytophthora rubi]